MYIYWFQRIAELQLVSTAHGNRRNQNTPKRGRAATKRKPERVAHDEARRESGIAGRRQPEPQRYDAADPDERLEPHHPRILVGAPNHHAQTTSHAERRADVARQLEHRAMGTR